MCVPVPSRFKSLANLKELSPNMPMTFMASLQTTNPCCLVAPTHSTPQLANLKELLSGTARAGYTALGSRWLSLVDTDYHFP